MFVMLTALVAVSTANAQQPVDYKTAYEKAQKGEKPLLVLITADWCPPCQVMKKTCLLYTSDAADEA